MQRQEIVKMVISDLGIDLEELALCWLLAHPSVFSGVWIKNLILGLFPLEITPFSLICLHWSCALAAKFWKDCDIERHLSCL
jgi:hypothetical protein